MGNEKKRYKKYLRWVGIAAFLILLIPIIMNFNKLVDFLSDSDKIKELILSYGHYSMLVFVFLQIIQIIVFFIPGEVVQFAGGYIFGPFLSFILCIAGVIVGSAVTFMISRKFGKPFVEKIVSEDSLWIVKKIEAMKQHREETHQSSKKKHPKTIIFILYMIPGIPKDILGYICGIADISLKEFLILSTIARSPALLISCFFGDKLDKLRDYFTGEDMWLWITGTVIFVIIVLIILYFSRKFINKLKEDVED